MSALHSQPVPGTARRPHPPKQTDDAVIRRDLEEQRGAAYTDEEWADAKYRFSGVGHVLEDRIFVFQCRIGIAGSYESIVEVEIRESPGPRKRTGVRAGNSKIRADSFISRRWKEQLVRLRDTKSRVD